MTLVNIAGLVLFNFTVFAQNILPQYPATEYPTSQGWIRHYSENNHFITQEIRRAADGWPQVITTKITQNPLEAEANLQNLLKQKEVLKKDLRSNVPQLTVAGTAIWPTRAVWNWEWEKQYAHWIETNVNEEIFEKAQIPTDCADVAIALRWIFAREYGLPMATTIGSGILMTNETMRGEWSNLPTHTEWQKDVRFVTALKYVMSLAYTHSLFADSYPIAINKDSFLNGVHNLHLMGNTGHTQTVFRRSDDSEKIPFLFIQSTMPTAVRRLFVSSFLNGTPTEIGKGGFLRIRWAIKTAGGLALQAGPKHPHYSMEQYNPGEDAKNQPYFQWFLTKLNPTLNFEKLLFKGYEDLKAEFQRRVKIVEDGAQACFPNRCRPGSQIYDDHSTPNRDEQLLSSLNQVEQLQALLKVDENIIADLRNEIAFELDGDPLSLDTLIWGLRKGLLKSDPNLSIGARWGLSSREWVETLKLSHSMALQSRQEKISKVRGKCDGDGCQPSSKDYALWSTSTLDAAFKNQLSLYSPRISKLTPIHRANLLQKISEANLQAAVESGWGWNSDPRIAEEKRWNSLKDRPHYVAPFGHTIHKMDSNYWAIISDENGQLHLKNVKTGQVWHKSYPKILLAPQGSRAVGCEKHACEFINLQSGSTFRAANFSDAHWLSHELVWMLSESGAQEYRWGEQEPQATRAIGSNGAFKVFTKSKSWVIFKDTQNAFIVSALGSKIFPLSQNDLGPQTFILPDEIGNIAFVGKTKSYWLSPDTLIELPSKIKPFWHSFVRREMIGLEEMPTTQTSKYKFSADGKVVAKERLGTFAIALQDGLTVVDGKSTKMFRIQNDKVEPIRAGPNEYLYMGETALGLVIACADRFIFEGGNSWIRYRNYTNGQIVLEAQSIYPAWRSSPYLIVTYVNDQTPLLVPQDQPKNLPIMTEVKGDDSLFFWLYSHEAPQVRPAAVVHSGGHDIVLLN